MNPKYTIDTEENRQYLRDMQKELLEFGAKFPAPEGGSYYLGDDGTPWTDRPIETWITCRMAHVYSMGHMMKVPGTDMLALKAIQGLRGILKDNENGGWYPGIDKDKKPLMDKQCYAHAFVILAGTSGKLAGIEGAGELLEDALETYDRFFWDESLGLAVDTYNTEFTKCDDYRGINANMHTVEAFLAVADANNDETYRVRAGRVIDHVVEWARDNCWRIPEHFTSNWEPDLDMNREKPDDPFKPYGATCGHGIEWARLITQWALSSKADASYIVAAENLYNRAIEDGWNSDGDRGIVYTTDWDGNPVVRDRMHWTLAEAINTSAVLYRTTKKQKYADDYAEFMQYLDEKVHDKINGSWFHQLDENNELKETVWPGKSDLYHAFQSMIIPYINVDTSIATYISREGIDKMEKKIDVVALGELLIDFTENGVSSQGNPIMEANPGGAPCNVLAMLKRFGHEVAFIGKVGNDALGHMLADAAEEVGIDVSGLLFDDQVHTTLAFVHTAKDGDRNFSFYRNPGADVMLKESEVPVELIESSKVFHFGTLSMTHDDVEKATKKAIAVAKDNKLIISFDPNLRPPLWDSLERAREKMAYGMSQCDILKISDNEIQFFTGEDDIVKGVEKIRSEYNIPLIFATLGKEGSMAFYKNMIVTGKPYVTDKTIETTGAGDTFMGCALHGILENGINNLTEEKLSGILDTANRAASVITTRRGALRVMPTLDEFIGE